MSNHIIKYTEPSWNNNIYKKKINSVNKKMKIDTETTKNLKIFSHIDTCLQNNIKNTEENCTKNKNYRYKKSSRSKKCNDSQMCRATTKCKHTPLKT